MVAIPNTLQGESILSSYDRSCQSKRDEDLIDTYTHRLSGELAHPM